MKNVFIGFRLTEAEKDRLVKTSAEADMTLSEFIRDIIDKYYKEQKE